jgi:hypothetical protein
MTMKKIILLYVLCAFVIPIYAQSDAFKDCLQKARFADGEWTAKSATGYLTNTLDKKTLSNTLFKNRMNEVKNVFLAAYPIPKAVVGEYWVRNLNESAYSLSDYLKLFYNGPQAFVFSTWFAPLKCKEDGSISKKFTSALEHYECNIFINTLNPWIEWTRPIDYLTKEIDTIKYPLLKNVFCVPPHDNIDIVNKSRSVEAKITNYNYDNSADNYFVFRNINDGYARPSAEYLDEFSEVVIMTHNNKFPYKALTKSELFLVLELYIIKENENYKTYLQKANDYESNKVMYRKNIAENETKIAQLQTLKTYFKSTINDDATVIEYYKSWRTIINELGDQKIYSMFIPIFKKGYTFSKMDGTFFKSKKTEDIQLICTNWYSKKFAGSHPSNNIKPNTRPLLDYGLTDAMKKMDWDKLASLLIK